MAGAQLRGGSISQVSMVYDCGKQDERDAGLAAAASAVRAGEMVVLPTDTVYGIGCDAFNPGAVRSVLAAKGRGPNMPIAVLVGSWSTIDGLVFSVPPQARTLIEAFWPGSLSIILNHAPSLSWDLGETRGTVALRMPLHPVALELLREVGPMAVSSANRSGQPSATTVAEAEKQLGESVSVYLDGGPSQDGIASTIISLVGEQPTVLREGGISVDDLSRVLGVEVQRMS